MKLHYDPKTDSLCIDLKPEPSAETREISPGFVVDLDAAGNVVAIDILHASARVDLHTIETLDLPLKETSAGTT